MLLCAALRMAMPRLFTQCHAKFHHRPPVTIKPAPQLLLQSIVWPYVAPPRSVQLSSAPSCSVESRTALHNSASLHHRSKFTIKTWPQLLLQVHEPGRGYPRALLRKLLLSELSRHATTARCRYAWFCSALRRSAGRTIAPPSFQVHD